MQTKTFKKFSIDFHIFKYFIKNKSKTSYYFLPLLQVNYKIYQNVISYLK